MGKINAVISDSGPLMHLAQVDSFDVLRVIKKIYIPLEIFDEICSSDLPGAKEVKKSKIIKVKNLGPSSKNHVKIISKEYTLGLGEAACISLAKQLNIKFFITDDLAARIVAKEFKLEPHGTMGIVLKAFKTGLIKRERAIRIINDLDKKSSLFLTSDLVGYIIKEIKKSRKR